MQHFELSLNEEISIYINSNLTPTEFFIVRLLLLALDGDEKPLINYISNLSGGKKLLREVIESLKLKQIINSTYQIPKEGEPLIVSNIPFNKNFLKMYVKESHVAAKEFFDLYPTFISINNKLVSIKNFTKANLFSFDDFCLFYTKQIKNNKITHDHIMESLQFAVDNNMIHYSILEFLASQKWKEIDILRSTNSVNGYNNTELL